MGGAQSSSGGAAGGAQEGRLKDLESILRGSGDLAILERAFSHLTASSSDRSVVPSLSLRRSISLAPISVDDKMYPELSKTVSRVGSAIFQELFNTEEEEISWIHLLEGFQKCTQSSGGIRLKQLISVYCRTTETKVPSKIAEKPSESGTFCDCTGHLTVAQLQDFLWFCWLLMCYTRLPSNTSTSKLEVFLPKINFLTSGAISVCDISKSKDASCLQIGLEKELSIVEISSWVLSTIPGIGDCLLQFLRVQLERLPLHKTNPCEEKEGNTTLSDNAGIEDFDISQRHKERHESGDDNNLLLQSGMAWAIGVSLRDYTTSEILFRASCGLSRSEEGEYPNLLYRSSIHGRGMNRFWTSVQGYGGLTLFLISAQTAEDGSVDSAQGHYLVLGGLIPGGFDNKESFYGASSSCLFALDPVFRPLHSTGREKNFVYSHKHTPGATYRAQPKAEGIGFGGTYGKERVWLSEEFGTLTVRHHAVDKTYEAGSIVPNQGYAPVVAKVMTVEVWGLGGKTAEQEQAGFLKRENLFSEQRRKVDLKTMFGTWENSPEKLMLDMVSDPNRPAQEER